MSKALISDLQAGLPLLGVCRRAGVCKGVKAGYGELSAET
jgi:hypothetical protein